MREGFRVGSVFLLCPLDLVADLEEVDCAIAEEQLKATIFFLSEMNLQQLRNPKVEIHCGAHMPSSSELFQ